MSFAFCQVPSVKTTPYSMSSLCSEFFTKIGEVFFEGCLRLFSDVFWRCFGVFLEVFKLIEDAFWSDRWGSGGGGGGGGGGRVYQSRISCALMGHGALGNFILRSGTPYLPNLLKTLLAVTLHPCNDMNLMVLPRLPYPPRQTVRLDIFRPLVSTATVQNLSVRNA